MLMRRKELAAVLIAVSVLCVSPLLASAEQTVAKTVDLKADMAVNGNLVLVDKGCINLNGHTLTVNGNLNQSGGVLDIGNGKVYVTGDYNLSGMGEFRITAEDAVFDVNGDVTINTSVPASNNQSNGTLKIGGNLSVESIFNPDELCYGRGYMPYNRHVTEFKGDADHKVHFSERNVNYLNIVKQSGNGKILFEGWSSGFTLGSDLTLENGSTIRGGRNLNLNKYTLTVDGHFVQDGSLTVNVSDSKLHVSGSYTQTKGVLDIGNGEVCVGGDYALDDTGELRITHEDGVLDVDGNVLINTVVTASNNQSNGTLKIGGDLQVKSPVNPDDLCYGRGYMPYNKHVTEFKGDSQHKVNFDEGSGNYFNIVKQSGEGKILLEGWTSGFTLGSDLTLTGGSTLRGGRNLNLNKYTLTVDGHFVQDGSLTVNVSDSKLHVSGSYTQTKGVLDIGNGEVCVGGDYALDGIKSDRELPLDDAPSSTGELRITQEDGVLDVDGNVLINTVVPASNNQSNGTLRIGGDLQVKSPVNPDELCYSRGYMPYNKHVTEFKGDSQQSIDFSGNRDNYLNIVKHSGEGKILLMGETSGFTLGSDLTLASGSTIKGSRNLNLNKYTLTVDGHFVQDGALTVNVSDSKLHVSGAYTQTKGVLDIGNGEVSISGNYDLVGTGELRITQEDGVLDVDGNVLINTVVPASNNQSNGTLKIGGDLQVKSPLNPNDQSRGRGYMPYNRHVTEFKGGKEHTVNFTTQDNYFNKIKLGVGDTLGFTGPLTGLNKSNGFEITAADPEIASVSGFSVQGAKQGETELTFKTSKTSAAKALIVK